MWVLFGSSLVKHMQRGGTKKDAVSSAMGTWKNTVIKSINCKCHLNLTVSCWDLSLSRHTSWCCCFLPVSKPTWKGFIWFRISLALDQRGGNNLNFSLPKHVFKDLEGKWAGLTWCIGVNSYRCVVCELIASLSRVSPSVCETRSCLWLSVVINSVQLSCSR